MATYKDITAEVLKIVTKTYSIEQLREWELDEFKVYQFEDESYTIDWHNDYTAEQIDDERCHPRSAEGIAEEIEIEIEVNYLR